MILKQHHFQTPERPKEEYYRIIGVESQKSHVGGLRDGGIYNKDPFQKDTAEWQSLYGEEPQPEWISFDEREPGVMQKIHCSHAGELIFVWNVWYTNENRHKRPKDLKYWCDANEFDARLQRWKDHQVKFQNFKKHVYKSTITEFSKTIEDKTVTVCFWADTGETVVSIINDQNEIIFDMSGTEIHLEEFEMVLKNRNIKL